MCSPLQRFLSVYGRAQHTHWFALAPMESHYYLSEYWSCGTEKSAIHPHYWRTKWSAGPTSYFWRFSCVLRALQRHSYRFRHFRSQALNAQSVWQIVLNLLGLHHLRQLRFTIHCCWHQSIDWATDGFDFREGHAQCDFTGFLMVNLTEATQWCYLALRVNASALNDFKLLSQHDLGLVDCNYGCLQVAR